MAETKSTLTLFPCLRTHASTRGAKVLMHRRPVLDWMKRGAIAVIGAPFIGRYALGQTVSIRLARMTYLAPEERQAWHDFTRNLKAASNDTIEISLVDPPRPALDDLLGLIAAGLYGGLYGAATLFAKRQGIYDPPEPGFSLIGNTLAAFETNEQQGQWFEEGGGDAAAAVYGTRSLLFMGAAPVPAGRLVLDRRIQSIDGLRGLRIQVHRGFTADLLVHVGIEPIFSDVRQDGGPSVGRITVYDTPSSAEFVLPLPVWMETRDINLGLRTADMLTREQQVLFELHVRLHARVLRSLIAQRENEWNNLLRSRGVEIIAWSTAQRTNLRIITNRFLRAWAAMGLPAEHGQRSSRERLVDSIEAFQRSRGLV